MYVCVYNVCIAPVPLLLSLLLPVILSETVNIQVFNKVGFKGLFMYEVCMNVECMYVCE